MDHLRQSRGCISFHQQKAPAERYLRASIEGHGGPHAGPSGCLFPGDPVREPAPGCPSRRRRLSRGHLPGAVHADLERCLSLAQAPIDPARGGRHPAAAPAQWAAQLGPGASPRKPGWWPTTTPAAATARPACGGCSGPGPPARRHPGRGPAGGPGGRPAGSRRGPPPGPALPRRRLDLAHGHPGGGGPPAPGPGLEGAGRALPPALPGRDRTHRPGGGAHPRRPEPSLRREPGRPRTVQDPRGTAAHVPGVPGRHPARPPGGPLRQRRHRLPHLGSPWTWRDWRGRRCTWAPGASGAGTPCPGPRGLS